MTTQTGLEQRALFESKLAELEFSTGIRKLYSKIISILQKQFPNKKLPIRKVDEAILLAKLEKLSVTHQIYGDIALQHFYYLLYKRKVFWQIESPRRSKLANLILTEEDFYPLLVRFKCALSKEKITENELNIPFYAMVSFFLFLKDTDKNTDAFDNADIIAYLGTINSTRRHEFSAALQYYDRLILKNGSVRDAEVIISFSDKNIEKEAKRIITKLLKGNIYSELTRKNLQRSVYLVLQAIHVGSIYDIAKGVGVHMAEDASSPYPLKEVLALLYRSFLPHDLPWIQKGHSLDDKLFSINKFTKMLLKEGLENAEIAGLEEKVSLYICWLYREGIDPGTEEELAKFLSHFKDVDERVSAEEALKQYQQFQKANALDENMASRLRERYRRLSRRFQETEISTICRLIKYAGKDEFIKLTHEDAIGFLESTPSNEIYRVRGYLAGFYNDILNRPLPKLETRHKSSPCIAPAREILNEVDSICKLLKEKSSLKAVSIENYMSELPLLLLHASKTKMIDISQDDIEKHVRKYPNKNIITMMKSIYYHVYERSDPFEKNSITEYVPVKYIKPFRALMADEDREKRRINKYVCALGYYCKWLEENNHSIETADVFLVEKFLSDRSNKSPVYCRSSLFTFYRLVLGRNLYAENSYAKLKICLREVALQQGHSEDFIISMTREVGAFFHWTKKNDFYQIGTKDRNQYLSDPDVSHNSNTEIYLLFFYTHVLKINIPSEALSITTLNERRQQMMTAHLSKKNYSTKIKNRSLNIIERFLMVLADKNLEAFSRVKVAEYLEEEYPKINKRTRYAYLMIICNFINDIPLSSGSDCKV